MEQLNEGAGQYMVEKMSDVARHQQGLLEGGDHEAKVGSASYPSNRKH